MRKGILSHPQAKQPLVPSLGITLGASRAAKGRKDHGCLEAVLRAIWLRAGSGGDERGRYQGTTSCPERPRMGGSWQKAARTKSTWKRLHSLPHVLDVHPVPDPLSLVHGQIMVLLSNSKPITAGMWCKGQGKPPPSSLPHHHLPRSPGLAFSALAGRVVHNGRKAVKTTRTGGQEKKGVVLT